jgi:ribosomal protein L36
MFGYCHIDYVDWLNLKVSTSDDKIQQAAHVVRRHGYVTNHAKGEQNVIQLTSRWVVDMIQSKV